MMSSSSGSDLNSYLCRNRNLEVSVVEYSFGYSEYVDEGHDEVDVSGLLHTAQALKKAAGDGSMSVVHVEFPKSVSCCVKNTLTLFINSKHLEPGLHRNVRPCSQLQLALFECATRLQGR